MNIKNKLLPLTAMTLLLGSCAVKKDYKEIPTEQMPSKHVHVPLSSMVEEQEAQFELSGNTQEVKKSIEDKLKKIHFDFDSAKVPYKELYKVDNIARALKEAPMDTTVMIIGHTDKVGNNSYNRMLGLERAKSVRDLLIKRGVDPSMVVIQSHGEKHPIVSTDDRERKNRRVIFEI